MMNSDNPVPGELKYKGVRKRKWGKWVSEIRLPHSRERIWLGSYDTPEKAARAFDAAQFCLRGRSANFNFPDNPPDIAGGQGLSPAEIQLAASQFANAAAEDPPSPALPQPAAADDHYAPSCSGGASVAQWDSDDVCLESRAGSVHGYDNNNNNNNNVDYSYDFSELDRMGSGFNYEAEFGLVSPGLGDFYGSQQQPDNPDFGYDNWNNGSGSQGSFLWNF